MGRFLGTPQTKELFVQLSSFSLTRNLVRFIFHFQPNLDAFFSTERKKTFLRVMKKNSLFLPPT